MNINLIITGVILFIIFIIISFDELNISVLNLSRNIFRYLLFKFKTLNKISTKNNLKENQFLLKMFFNISISKHINRHSSVEYNYKEIIKYDNTPNDNIRVPVDYVFFLYLNNNITFDNLRYILQDYNGNHVMI